MIVVESQFLAIGTNPKLYIPLKEYGHYYNEEMKTWLRYSREGQNIRNK